MTEKRFIPPVAPPWGIMGLEYDDSLGYYLRISPEYLFWLQSILEEDCNCPKANGKDHNGCIAEEHRFIEFAQSLEPIVNKKL